MPRAEKIPATGCFEERLQTGCQDAAHAAQRALIGHAATAFQARYDVRMLAAQCFHVRLALNCKYVGSYFHRPCCRASRGWKDPSTAGTCERAWRRFRNRRTTSHYHRLRRDL